MAHRGPAVVAGSAFVIVFAPTVMGEIWGRGVNSPSEASVLAVGRSVTAGDLEMLLQSPTKQKKRDNKALIRSRRQLPSDRADYTGRGPGRFGPNGFEEGDGATRETLGFSQQTVVGLFFLICARYLPQKSG